jgi:hypothetical protein
MLMESTRRCRNNTLVLIDTEFVLISGKIEKTRPELMDKRWLALAEATVVDLNLRPAFACAEGSAQAMDNNVHQGENCRGESRRLICFAV